MHDNVGVGYFDSLWVAFCREVISENFADQLAFNLRAARAAVCSTPARILPPSWYAYGNNASAEAHWRLRAYMGEKLSPWGSRLSLTQSQQWLDSVIGSKWLRSHYPHLGSIKLVASPLTNGMFARLREGEIHACHQWLSDHSLCHELAHFLQPTFTSPHGPEFATTLLLLQEQFRPAPAAAWLRQGYQAVGMPTLHESELQALLDSSHPRYEAHLRPPLSLT